MVGRYFVEEPNLARSKRGCQVLRITKSLFEVKSSTSKTTKMSAFKAITTEEHVQQWLSSSTCKNFLTFLQNIINASSNATIQYIHNKPLPSTTTTQTQAIIKLITTSIDTVKAHPPTKQPQRYGNTAFRGWLTAIESDASSSMSILLSTQSPTTYEKLSQTHQNVLVDELATYWKISFGNSTRIDYGTGHEANFLMWLYCLGQLNVLELNPDQQKNHLQEIALCIYPAYLHLARVLQRTYMLEPAGSHGVWSLDDYCFLPFLLGASQLSKHKHIRPRSILYNETVDGYAQDYLYLSAIQFINTVKKGPFQEHSHILHELAKHVSTWEEISQGLLRMFQIEVLGKFPVAQHFYFGTLLPPTWLTQTSSNSGVESSHDETATMAANNATTEETKTSTQTSTQISTQISTVVAPSAPSAPSASRTTIPTMLKRPIQKSTTRNSSNGINSNGTDVLSRYFGKRTRGGTGIATSVGLRTSTPRLKQKHTLYDNNTGIFIKGWSIKSNKGKMTDGIELDNMSNPLKFPTPEIVFGHNSMVFEHVASGLVLNFNSLDALRSCLILKNQNDVPNRTIIKFALAEKWEERSKELNINMEPTFAGLDWTYTPVYYGTNSRNTSGTGGKNENMTRLIKKDEKGIDYNNLKDRNAPILWYDVCEFYETELDDCGSGTMEAKVRVMPSCFFLLLRWWLRIDDSHLRIFDTRVYHGFGDATVVFEIVQKEISYVDLKNMGKSVRNMDYTDPNVFGDLLKEVKKEIRILEL